MEDSLSVIMGKILPILVTSTSGGEDPDMIIEEGTIDGYFY